MSAKVIPFPLRRARPTASIAGMVRLASADYRPLPLQSGLATLAPAPPLEQMLQDPGFLDFLDEIATRRALDELAGRCGPPPTIH